LSASEIATEETLQRIYETISDKPERIVKYENAPRPDDAAGLLTEAEAERAKAAVDELRERARTR
jgi:hypothetical protein